LVIEKHAKKCRSREKYHDFGPTFAVEKLHSHGFNMSRKTLRQWMIEAHIWKGQKRKNACIHQSRKRRPRFGELAQIDGSHHDWFEGRAPKCCLLVFIDDTTSKIIALRFSLTETTLGYMQLIKQHVNQFGRVLAYYSDKASIFRINRKQTKNGRLSDTQLHRALRDLDIQLICAHSAEAKGRVERANKTLQDRLVKEMRLRNISCIDQANEYLPEFIHNHNKQFAKSPEKSDDAHRPFCGNQEVLDLILSSQNHRKLSKNLEFSWRNQVYKILTQTTGYRLRYKIITVCELIDGTIQVTLDAKPLSFICVNSQPSTQIVASKELNVVIDAVIAKMELSDQEDLPYLRAN